MNIEEAMVIKISALDVTGFAKLLRTVYIDENAACSTERGSACGIYRVLMIFYDSRPSMASCFYSFAVFSAADSLGRHTFKMIATSAAGTIPEPPKIKRTGSGRYVRAAALEPRP